MTRAVAVWLLLSAIWGSTWLFIKVGLDDLPPFSFAGMRFAVAVVPLALIVILRRTPFPRAPRDWALMVWTGLVIFAGTYGLVFWAEQYISSGLAALLFATFPLFGLVAAHRSLPAERMTVLRVSGVLLGIVGVGLVLSTQLGADGPLALWGSAAIVLAALGAAYAHVAIKRHAGHIDPAALTLVQMLAGMVPLLALGVALEDNPFALRWTATAVFSLLYLALVGSALAFVLLYWLIKHMDVTKTMLITLVTPLIAVLLGIVILDEALTWRTTTGGLAIMAGLALTVFSPQRTSPDGPQPPEIPHG